MTDLTSTQPTVADILLRILGEADNPIGYRRIAEHPLAARLREPAIHRGLAVARHDGLIRQVRRDVYELTGRGRTQLGEEPLPSV